MKLLYAAEQRRLRNARANLIDDIGAAYMGCRTEEGMKAKHAIVKALRKE